MPDVKGYAGKFLYIDLSQNKVEPYNVDEDTMRLFIGGRGLGAKLLFDNLPVDVNPLGPENVLVVTTGPLVGAPFFGIKHVITTKSPLTGGFLDTYGGGHFAAELKFAGYDGLIITGKADQLVYLYINNDTVEIRDAAFLTGKGVFATERLLRETVADKTARVMCIGPAGEKLVRFAHIANDMHHACGRGGGGCVFGSKRLKAIVVRGNKGIRFADPNRLLTFINNTLEQRIKNNPAIFNNVKYGKAYTMEHTQRVGMLPTRNFKYAQYKDYKWISGPHAREAVVKSDKGCFACNMPCGSFSQTGKGPYQGASVIGPHYEANVFFGSNVENNNIEAIVMANYLCNDLGMDYMSTGNTIAFAIECFERGLITEKDTGGIALKFGDNSSILAMVKKIALREDIGELLGEGVKRASEKIGKESGKFAIQAKGLELPAYDPRGVPALALAMSISDRGACHRRMSPASLELYHPNIDIEAQAERVKELYDLRIPMHCASICDTTGGLYTKMNAADFAEVFTAATGWDISETEVKMLCERVATICLAFNLREKAPFSKEANLNSFPYRLVEEPIPEGPTKGRTVKKDELEVMLTKYLQLRGWDPLTGIPKKETMQKLSLFGELELLTNLGIL